MTEFPPPRPPVGPAAGDVSPLVELAPLIRCGAGDSATFEVFVTHRGPEAAHLRITVLGLDGRWVPPPLPVGPIEPGETTRITLSLVPERGTLGAQYPFVVAAEASPVSGKGSTVMGVAESTLAVDGRDPITMTVSPQTPVAAFSRRVKVQITNPGHVDRELRLSGSAARGAALSLSSSVIVVPAGRTVTVPGRVRVTHPRLIGHPNTHTFAVAARGQGAPEFAEGTLRSKPVIGGRITGLLIAVVVIALWAGAAIVGIPKLSNYFAGKNDAPATATSSPSGGAAASGAATSGGASSGAGSSGAGSSGAPSSGAGGSGGSGAGGSGTGGSGTGGSGAGGGAGAAGGAADAAVGRLSGTITGITPKGVQVTLEPTSLVEAAAAGAAPAAGVTDPSTATSLRSVSTALGKVPADAVRIATAATDTGIRTTTSAADGSFSFSGISAPGYYLLTMAKAGFATQRFMVNAATLTGATPLKVALVPGNGSMSGKVSSAVGGKVGAASVTITDGTVSLQTSSSSKTGVWTVKGLSTPGTYLVTVSSPGYGASSKLVTLAAGGTGTADLALTPGVAAIGGTVSGVDELGHLGGIGGVTVTATGTSQGVKASRTATTVTSGPVGTFSLPDLPVPGDYTVTVSGTGYAAQTQQVSLAAGSSLATVNVSLTRADGTVSGTVVGDGAEGGLIGAGLTLTGAAASYKTMTTSVPAGAYRFTGVPPGTYVLQGSQYGRVASSATVVVTAAGTAIANLHLVGAPDTELPATARIKGRAVDSRTQGPLTCDRAAIANPVCEVTASVPVPVRDKSGRTVSTRTITSVAGPAEDYTLPSLDSTQDTGLVAGLYAVTLSAPGYESTTVQIQVSQGQVTPAPQVSLPPLGLISGTITSHAGTPVTPSCVVSVPAGTAVPTACTRTSPTTCVATASPTARCSVTGLGGTYEIRGLVHGGYQVVVLPTDREYLATTPLAVQLELGGDYRFDTALDRLGRATVTVLAPNLSSLALGAAKGAVVGMVDAGGIGRGSPLPGDSTASDGILTITNLLGSYSAQATGDIPTGLSTGTTILPGTASVPTGSIGLNQTVAITEVLTAPIGAVVGHVTVSVDGEVRNVAGTPVQVSGVVGFSGRIPVSGSVTVPTDANGCYAIVPVGWKNQFPLTSSDCPVAISGKSASVMRNTDGSAASLIALPIGVSVAANDDPVTHNPSTQNYSASGVLIGFTGEVSVIPPISLLAQPSDFPDLTLDLKAPTGIPTDASNTSIVVTRKPAGAGNITVKAEADGTLSFSDSLLVAGKAVPGLYTLSATKLGYSTAAATAANGAGMASGYATLWCDLGRDCRFGTRTTAAAAWTMSQLPTISGTIVAPSLPPGVDLVDADISVNAAPSAAGSISVKLAADGSVIFRDASLLGAQSSGLSGGLAQPTAAGAPYRFTLTLRGYVAQQISITCGATYLDGCTAFDATLIPLPRFTGSIALAPAAGISGETLAGVTVSVSPQPAPPGTPVVVGIADTTALTSSLTWQDPNQPASVITYGNYSVTFAKTGYRPVTVAFPCPTGALTCVFNNGNPVTLTMFPKGAGTVSVTELLPGGADIWPSAVVTLTSAPAGTAGLKVTVVADATNPKIGRFVWVDSGLPANLAGITQPGTYSLTVAVPGYGSATSPPITCAAGGVCAPSAGNLARLAVFAGTVTTTPTVAADTSGLAGLTATVTAQPIPSPTGSGITVDIAADGTLSWDDPAQPAGIVASGSYTVVFAKPGYAPITTTFTCASGTCGPGTVNLLEFPLGSGTVSVADFLPGTNAVNWNKAVVSVASDAPGGTTSTVKVDTTQTGLDTTLIWSDPALPYAGLTVPATYTITVAMPGYGTLTSQPFSCAAGSPTVAGSVPCAPNPAMVLGLLPVFSGTVTATSTITGAADTTSGVNVAVNAQPNPNTSPVSVTVDAASGQINWADPSQPAGVIVAGSYSLTFTKAGYAPKAVQFTCAADGTGCNIGTVALLMDPHGTGSVSVTVPPPNGAAIDWTKATLTLVNQAPGSSTLTISLIPDGTPASLTANFSWADSALPFPGITQPGDYRIRVTLPGYGSATSGLFTCNAGDQTCGPTLLLTQQPTFTGIVTTNPAGGSLLGTVVSVTSPAGVNAVTATVAASTDDPTNGTILWQEAGGAPPGLVSYGTYQISVSNSNYLPTTAAFTCSTTTCVPPTLLLTRTSTLQVNLVSTSGAAPVNGGLFNLTGTLITGSTVSAAATSNTVSFPGQSPLGDYTLNVHAAGFANDTFTKSTLSTSSCTNGTVTKTGFSVLPGGTTVCTVVLSPLGTITVHTVGLSAGTSSVLPSTTVTVVKLVGGSPSGPSFSGVTSITGDLSLTGDTTNDGLTAGTWRVTATQTGYTNKVGTVDIDATANFAMANPTGGLTLSGGVLEVQLSVKPVELQVHLTLNDVESLPAVKVSIAGPATFNCTIVRTSATGVTPETYACSETSATGTVSSGTTVKYVDFPSVPPGVYTITVSSPTSAYRTYSQQTQIAAGTPIQYVYIPLDQRASTQSGTVFLGNTPNTGITVTMRAAQDITAIQKDLNNDDLSVHPNSSGLYTFTNVPDGVYTVVAEFAGYAFATYPSTVTEDSGLNKSPPALAAFSLTARATRSVDVTVTSAAGGTAADLSGATVTLTRTGTPVTGFTDAAVVLTLPATGPFTVNVPQMPTGTWSAVITGQKNSPYQGNFTGQTVVVPQGPVSASPPVVAAALAVQQALTTLTVTWDTDIIDPDTPTCLTAPATAPATLALVLTDTVAGTTKTIAAQVVVGASTATATAAVYLPQGSYSFTPTLEPTMWTAATTTFTVANPSAGNATSNPAAPTVALVPAKVPVAVSMLVDGVGAGANGLTVTATKGNSSPTAVLDSNGQASLCLAPGSGWVFSLSSTTVNVSAPNQTVNVQAAPTASDPALDNAVAFTAFTVTPQVSLATVTGRTSTAASDVVVAITRDGNQVYSKTAPGVAPGAPATAPAVILGQCSSCVYSIKATPPAGPFGASTAQTFTPAATLSVPVTLPYIAAMVTVTVTHGAAIATPGAAVTINVAGITAPDTDASGKSLIQDVPVIATARTFTATWTDTVPTTPKNYSGTANKILVAGANTVTVPMT